MITTTLKDIRSHSPCEDGWIKLCKSLGGIKAYGEETPLTFKQILDSNGIEDAIWCLRALPSHDREIRLFAADCAESTLHLFESKHPDDDRPRKAIEAARDYVNGLISLDELRAAARAAADAADARAAAYAAYAAYAAWAAAWAAAAAAADAERAAWAAADAADAAAWAAAYAADAAAWAAWAAADAADAAAWAAAYAADADAADADAEREKRTELFIKYFCTGASHE